MYKYIKLFFISFQKMSDYENQGWNTSITFLIESKYLCVHRNCRKKQESLFCWCWIWYSLWYKKEYWYKNFLKITPQTLMLHHISAYFQTLVSSKWYKIKIVFPNMSLLSSYFCIAVRCNLISAPLWIVKNLSSYPYHLC